MACRQHKWMNPQVDKGTGTEGLIPEQESKPDVPVQRVADAPPVTKNGGDTLVRFPFRGATAPQPEGAYPVDLGNSPDPASSLLVSEGNLSTEPSYEYYRFMKAEVASRMASMWRRWLTHLQFLLIASCTVIVSMLLFMFDVVDPLVSVTMFVAGLGWFATASVSIVCLARKREKNSS